MPYSPRPVSEFSDSMHFYNVAGQELRTQLQARGIRAFILNTSAPISVLIGWEDKEKAHDVGACLDFSYGEDHGVHCKFYRAGALVGRLNVEWGGEDCGIEEPPGSPNHPGISGDLETILARDFGLSETDAKKVRSITARYDLADFEQHDGFVDELGALLGLKHFRWLSCTDLEHNIERLLETNPDGAVN